MLRFTFDLYLIMSSVKQGGFKYHFYSLVWLNLELNPCPLVHWRTLCSLEQMAGIHQWPEKPRFNPRSSHTKDWKMVLNTQHSKVRIKSKVGECRKSVSALLYTLETLTLLLFSMTSSKTKDIAEKNSKESRKETEGTRDAGNSWNRPDPSIAEID